MALSYQWEKLNQGLSLFERLSTPWGVWVGVQSMALKWQLQMPRHSCSDARRFRTQQEVFPSIRGTPKGHFCMRKYNHNWSQSLCHCQKSSSSFEFWDDCRRAVIGFYCCGYQDCCSKAHLSILMLYTSFAVLNCILQLSARFCDLLCCCIWLDNLVFASLCRATVKYSRWSLHLRGLQ